MKDTTSFICGFRKDRLQGRICHASDQSSGHLPKQDKHFCGSTLPSSGVVHSRVKLGECDRQFPGTTKCGFWAGTREANQPSEEEGSQLYLTEVCSGVLVVVWKIRRRDLRNAEQGARLGSPARPVPWQDVVFRGNPTISEIYIYMYVQPKTRNRKAFDVLAKLQFGRRYGLVWRYLLLEQGWHRYHTLPW